MNLQATLAFEKCIIEKINKAKLCTLKKMGVLSETSSNDIATAIASVNPLVNNRLSQIIVKLCEINTTKEKHVDLKKVTWDYFLEEKQLTINHANRYVSTVKWYSNNRPKHLKWVINSLDEIIYYANGESFTLLDLIFAVNTIDLYHLIFDALMTRKILQRYKKNEILKQVYKSSSATFILCVHTDHCHLFTRKELKFIETLPKNT
jgi:hypothetical protein